MMVVPREFYKSTMVRLYAIWRILHNPDIVILFDGETSRHAHRSVRLIKRIFESSQFVEVFGDWSGKMADPRRTGWKEDELTVIRRTRVGDAPTVLPGGVEVALTGLHPDLYIGDDLTGETNSRTQDMRQRVKDHLESVVKLLGVGGEAILLDTIWHLEDHTNLILNDPDRREIFDIMLRSAADKHGPFIGVGDGELNRSTYSEARLVMGWSEDRIASTDGGFMFPDMVDSGFLDRALRGSSRGSISRQFFNNPVIEEESIGRCKGYFTDSPPGQIVIAVDLAAGREYSRANTGFVVAKMTAPDHPGEIYGNFWVLEAYDRDWPINRTISEIFMLEAKYRDKGFWKLIVERAAQDTSTDTIRMEMARRATFFPFDDPAPSALESKSDRIRIALKPQYENGRVFHHESLRGGVLESQLMNFGASGKVDVIDAMSRAFMALRPPGGGQVAKSGEDYWGPKLAEGMDSATFGRYITQAPLEGAAMSKEVDPRFRRTRRMIGLA